MFYSRRLRFSLFKFAIAAASLSAAKASAQGVAGSITGVVTDSSDSKPLPAVQIIVAGTRFATQTNDAGRYTINNVPAGRYNITARRLGYRAVTVAITVGSGATASQNFRLDPVGLTLEAVVTTGVVDPASGTRTPFTVGRVDAENAPVPSSNAIETIQGKIAGVTVVPSGQPGSGTNILLRSPTSISKSIAPLIVVDGVIL